MNVVDFHIHTAPSLMPRHYTDSEVGPVLRQAGIGTYVLKAHEGSTAERALIVGGGAVGSIVLNSPVGGANPDAVSVAAAFGARVAWLPTVSSEAHQRARHSSELKVHRSLNFRPVAVTQEDRVLPEWADVFDVVAAHDMILASGHISLDETVTTFRAARRHGVTRFLVNHPLMPFLGWREEHAGELMKLGAYIEVGVMADQLAGGEKSATARLSAVYPASLLVFGSDLGHTDYPDIGSSMKDWVENAESLLGGSAVELIAQNNGATLLTA